MKLLPLSPKQSKLYSMGSLEHWIVVACGTIRSGKSLAGIFGYLKHVMTTFSGGDHIVACFSDNVWRATIIKYVSWWCRLTGRTIRSTSKGFVISGRDAKGKLITNTFYRVTGRDIGSVARVQGMGDVQTVFVTEGALMPQVLLDEFIRRMAVAPLETRLLYIDCNPEGGPQHWFKTCLLYTSPSPRDS